MKSRVPCKLIPSCPVANRTEKGASHCACVNRKAGLWVWETFDFPQLCYDKAEKTSTVSPILCQAKARFFPRRSRRLLRLMRFVLWGPVSGVQQVPRVADNSNHRNTQPQHQKDGGIFFLDFVFFTHCRDSFSKKVVSFQSGRYSLRFCLLVKSFHVRLRHNASGSFVPQC